MAKNVESEQGKMRVFGGVSETAVGQIEAIVAGHGLARANSCVQAWSSSSPVTGGRDLCTHELSRPATETWTRNGLKESVGAAASAALERKGDDECYG